MSDEELNESIEELLKAPPGPYTAREYEARMGALRQLMRRRDDDREREQRQQERRAAAERKNPPPDVLRLFDPHRNPSELVRDDDWIHPAWEKRRAECELEPVASRRRWYERWKEGDPDSHDPDPMAVGGLDNLICTQRKPPTPDDDDEDDELSRRRQKRAS